MTTPPAQDTPVLTVTELTQLIKQQLEESFPFLTLQGEISNFKQQSSGHLYFSLKDSKAQISAVMFRGSASKVKQLPKNGDSVIIKGEIAVYAPRGNYQIIVKELTLAGVGELLQRLEELKVKLYKQGYFAQERKRPLPSDPRCIGIVTSPTGAAVQDMLNVLSRRQAGLRIVLYPVKVQGEGSAKEIAHAIDTLNAHKACDVMIVGRGGGSVEDLWAFNEEIVAQAIYNSAIPVIGAVGHETDHCIAEHVADLRAPTPSAAAELVTAERGQQVDRYHKLVQQLKHTLGHLVSQNKHRLEGILRHPIFCQSHALTGPWMQRLDDLRDGIDSVMVRSLQDKRARLEALQRQHAALNPRTQIRHQRQKLLQLQTGLDAAMQTVLRRDKEKLRFLKESLAAIDPQALLKKGYSLLFNEKDGSVITSVQQFRPSDEIRMRLADGSALATIKDIEPQ